MTQAKTVPCDYCGNPAPLVTGEVVYPHRPDLWEKKFYACMPCGAWVGTHEGTENSLGRLANAELRRAKTAAHAAFDPVWQGTNMRRRDAYLWLAQELHIDPKDCHIGMFDLDQCRAVVAAVHRLQVSDTQARRPRLDTLPARRTGPAVAPAHCGCDVLPWEHCIHTRDMHA